MAESKLAKFIANLKKATVEPYVFFCFFGYAVCELTFQNLLVDRACRNWHLFPDEICDRLDDHEHHRRSSIEVGTNLYCSYFLVSCAPSVVVATFLGPWSDKHSRKYPLMIAASGMLLESITTAVLSFFPDVSPAWFILPAIFAGMSGGQIVAISSSFSYVADVTDERSRPSRYAFLEVSNTLAIVSASSVGGAIFRSGSYATVMLIAPCSFGLAILYTALVVKETKPRVEGQTCRDMFRDLITVDNIKESYRTCSRKRPGNVRLQIWLLVWASCSQKFVDMGTLAIIFPFARGMYSWDVTDFSIATTAFYLVTAFATSVVVPLLSNRYHLHEAALGVIGMLSLTAKMTLISVAYYQPIFYYAWLSGCLNNSAAIAVRSRLSKLVDKDEMGRAFSLLGTCESVTPLLGTLVFVQVYNASVNIFPGLPFAASAVFLVPSVVLFSWMMRLPTVSLGDYGKAERVDARPLETISSSRYATLQEERI